MCRKTWKSAVDKLVVFVPIFPLQSQNGIKWVKVYSIMLSATDYQYIVCAWHVLKQVILLPRLLLSRKVMFIQLKKHIKITKSHFFIVYFKTAGLCSKRAYTLKSPVCRSDVSHTQNRWWITDVKIKQYVPDCWAPEILSSKNRNTFSIQNWNKWSSQVSKCLKNIVQKERCNIFQKPLRLNFIFHAVYNYFPINAE